MYFEIIFLMIIVLPPIMMSGLVKKKLDPYYIIGLGTIFACAGVVCVFLAGYLSGESLGDYVTNLYKDSVKTLANNQTVLDALGMDKEEATKELTAMCKAAQSLVPSMIIILTAIISYIEYNFIVRMRFREGTKPFAYMRNFALKPNDVMGWFLIYLGGYLLKALGLTGAGVVIVNINILVQAIIALQGIGVIFLFFKERRTPRIVPFLICVALWIIPIGHTALFMLGVIDLLINIRFRITKGAGK